MDFRLLGPIEVWDCGEQIAVGAGKQRALLALLLLHVGHAVPVDQVVDELWGGNPPATAVNALWVYVANLRRALEPGRARGTAWKLLVTGPSSYALHVDGEAIDSVRFERLGRAGRETLGDDPQTALGLLREALQLWRGPALAELDTFEFARAERARLEELKIAAVEARIEAELIMGRHVEVVAELKRSVGSYPLRERFHELLMTALYRSHRQAEALVAYEQARKVLVSELGLDPSAPLQRLHQAILRHDPVLDWSPKLSQARTPRTGAAASVAVPGKAADSGQPFLGRDAEVAALREALEEARAGHGRMILVAGEPGIGKTRLGQCLAEEAQRLGMPAWWGRAWEDEGAPGFWPLIQIGRSIVRSVAPERLRRAIGRDAAILGQILPEVGDEAAAPDTHAVLDSAEARFRLFDSMTRLLVESAADTGALVVLDDLHGADRPSLALLRFLVRELANARLLVLCTYRDVGVSGGSLSGFLADVVREQATQRLELKGLSIAEVGRLIEVLAGKPVADDVAAATHQKTGGNPFFTTELARLLISAGQLNRGFDEDATPVPPTVVEVVRSRVRTLPETSRRVLTVASAIGRDFDAEIVAAAAQLPVDDVLRSLDDTARAGLSVPDVTQTRQHAFAHALVRDALYGQLGAAERARLHERIGTALEQARASDLVPYLAELASHFLRATPALRLKALEYTIRAGQYAMDTFAYEEAVRLFTRALEEPVDRPQRCDLLAALGEAQMKAGDTKAALTRYIEAAEIARSLGSPDRLARTALGIVEMAVFTIARADLREIIAGLLEDALPRLTENTALRARVQAMLAIALFFPPLDRWHEVRDRQEQLTREALRVAAELRDDDLTALAMHARSTALFGPDNLDERNQLAPQIERHARAAGNTALVLEGLRWQVVNAAETGDLTTMQHAMEHYARIGSQLRQPLLQFWSKVWNSTLATLRGDFDRAEREIVESLSLGQHLEGLDDGEMQNGVGAQLLMLRRLQGRAGELAPAAEHFVSAYPEVPGWRAGVAAIRTDQQDRRGAREVFDAFSAEAFGGVPRDGVWLVALCLLAEVCAFLDDGDSADVLYTILKPYANRCPVITWGFGWLGPVDHYLGMLAATSQHYDVASAHFEAAWRRNERLQAQPWLARTKFEYARSLLARGRPLERERAMSMLAEARTVAAAIGLALPDLSPNS
jgi:DNA-binding SARP family transcriptional activator/tetratricopeptide (TPR) repeat protein